LLRVCTYCCYMSAHTVVTKLQILTCLKCVGCKLTSDVHCASERAPSLNWHDICIDKNTFLFLFLSYNRIKNCLLFLLLHFSYYLNIFLKLLTFCCTKQFLSVCQCSVYSYLITNIARACKIK